MIKETAVLHNWPDKVVWSGAHNGRNGSAKDVFDQALAQVQAAGVWDRLESSEIYGGPRQACDTAQDFRAFLAAQNAGLAERLRAAGLQGVIPRSLPPAVRNTAAAELTAPGPSPRVNPTTSRRATPKEDARKKKAKANQAAPAAKKKKPVKRWVDDLMKGGGGPDRRPAGSTQRPHTAASQRLHPITSFRRAEY